MWLAPALVTSVLVHLNADRARALGEGRQSPRGQFGLTLTLHVGDGVNLATAHIKGNIVNEHLPARINHAKSSRNQHRFTDLTTLLADIQMY